MPEPSAEEHDGTAIVELDIAVPTDEVWAALTTEEGLRGWLGGDATIDADPGGRVYAPDPVSGRPREGYVDTIDPGRELAFTWWPADDPSDASHVSIVVVPVGRGSRIRVVERPRVAPATACAVGRHRAEVRSVEHAEWQWRCAVLAVSSPVGTSPDRVRV